MDYRGILAVWRKDEAFGSVALVLAPPVKVIPPRRFVRSLRPSRPEGAGKAYTRGMDVRRGMRFASETESGDTVAFTVHEVEVKGDVTTIYLRDDRGNIVPAKPEEFEDGPDGEIPKYLEDE